MNLRTIVDIFNAEASISNEGRMSNQTKERPINPQMPAQSILSATDFNPSSMECNNLNSSFMLVLLDIFVTEATGISNITTS